jgi:nucleoside 2-deoxyribosyltransferase
LDGSSQASARKKASNKEEATAMKIYLSARYSRAKEMRAKAAELRRLGFTPNCRWIEELQKPHEERDLCDNARYAEEDLGDIETSDCIISFTEGRGAPVRSGGRHFEAGYACRAGLRMFFVGPRENVFHFLPDAKFFDTWEQCLDELRAAPTIGRNQSGLR